MLFNPHKVGLHRVLRHIPLVGRLLDARHQARLRRAVNLADLRQIARDRAHRMVFDYMDGGADDEVTLRRNKDTYTELEMHYRVLAGNSPQTLDLSTNLFGLPVKLPFFGCPTAGNKMFHIQGEAAAARAAVHHGSVYALSSLSTTSFDNVDAATTKTVTRTDEEERSIPRVFQLYVWRDREIVRDILAQVKEHKYDALALTVDVSWMGNRERDLRNGFSIPPNYRSLQQTIQAILKPAWTWDFISNDPFQYACINQDVPAESLVSFINRQLTPDFNWADAEWLLGEWGGKHAAIKGIVRPDDAVHAVATGFDTVWVSNHGGRQLESAPATISVLPSIRNAVGDKGSIILDGGIQRGTDIAKAIALGADGVGVGKPYLWGLAAGGAPGVIKAYDILKVELERAMGLLGVRSIAELRAQGPELVKPRLPSARDYPDWLARERGYGGGII